MYQSAVKVYHLFPETASATLSLVPKRVFSISIFQPLLQMFYFRVLKVNRQLHLCDLRLRVCEELVELVCVIEIHTRFHVHD